MKKEYKKYSDINVGFRDKCFNTISSKKYNNYEAFLGIFIPSLFFYLTIYIDLLI